MDRSPRTVPSAPADKVYGVSELGRALKTLVEGHFGQVWVEGEVSGLSRPASGHLYFDLKDADAVLNVAFFKGSQRGLKAEPANGSLVRAFGEITAYPRNSRYQMICRRLEASGTGKLHEAFERLKKKLEQEGLFAPERKRSLPFLPRRIGIVTSPTGAAVRDMLQILDRRFPHLHIRIAGARVQGAGAAEEIAEGIARLNRFEDIDLLIVGRGGGSMEDLWAFNEEVTARAIVASRIPVISAVGHETDFTIADFVADLRAPTPSAAAELAVRPRQDLLDMLHRAELRLQRALVTSAEASGQQLDGLDIRLRHAVRVPLQARRAQLAELPYRSQSALRRLIRHRHQVLIDLSRRLEERSPRNRLLRIQSRLSRLEQRLVPPLRRVGRDREQKLTRLSNRLEQTALQRIRIARQRLDRAADTLEAMNPGSVLQRGYSLTQTEDGQLITTADQAGPGAKLHTRLARGHLISTVDSSSSKETPE